MTSEDYQRIMLLTQPYVSGLGKPVKKPVRKTWQAVFNADWKLLRYTYLKDGEICPTWLLHWDDCMRELRTPMANDEAKAPAVTMASLATVAYDPSAIAFAHEAWASPRLEGESDEDYGQRLAEVPSSEQTNRVELVGLVMLIRDGGKLQRIGRYAKPKRNRRGHLTNIVIDADLSAHQTSCAMGWIDKAIGDHLLNRYTDEQRKQARDIIDCFWKTHHARENPEWLRQHNPTVH